MDFNGDILFSERQFSSILLLKADHLYYISKKLKCLDFFVIQECEHLIYSQLITCKLCFMQFTNLI